MSHLRMRKLSSQIFAAQLAILTATALIGFLLFAHEQRLQLDHQYELRAASIAQTVAGVPDIQRCMAIVAQAEATTPVALPSCNPTIQTIASRIQQETGASYVVVIDMHRFRHSHPDPTQVGQQVVEPIATVDGRTHVGLDNGSTRLSANGKAPLYSPSGAMVGEVSVGLRESSVSAALWHILPGYAGWFAIALACGALASWALAARLKRRTFGLELDEIAKLLQEREATLHGIREGVIAFDESGRVSMVNDEAERLLDLGTLAVGAELADLIPPGRLRDVLSGAVQGQDEVVLTDDYCLTVNRMPVTLGGRAHGSVVTLRDRTEMSGLLRELDGVRSLTDSLRSQQHEFSNRMHAVAGLIELGNTDEALTYLTDLSGTEARFAESLRARIASPLIVGLLLGKSAEASERGIALEITDDTWLGEAPEKVQALTTILGNLIDNALDSVANSGPTPRVLVAVIEDDDAITVRVSDNGPGIPPGHAQAIFADGYTTKPDNGSNRRGLGLALVHRLVQRLNGTIEATEGPGAVFTVQLPKAATALPVPSGPARR